jgi:hypothetical protein
MRQGRRARGYPSSGHHGGFNTSRYLGFAGNPGPSRGGTDDNGWERSLGQLLLVCLTTLKLSFNRGFKAPGFFRFHTNAKSPMVNEGLVLRGTPLPTVGPNLIPSPTINAWPFRYLSPE